MSAKISIIVPVYKVEAYLERCITSIINQTYQDLEIILVDDGSPDGCGSICDKYAESDSRIKVIHKENGGLSDARNAGIDIATGDYLGFVDSDDYIHPEMYETLYLNLIQTGSDISICDFEKVYGDKTIFEYHENQTFTYTNTQSLEQLFTFYTVTFTVAWNKLYKRELFEDIRYPKGRIREDEFTTYKLFYKANKIVETLKPMYFYFQTQNSIMHNNTITKEVHYAEAMEERLIFFQQHNLEYLFSLGIQYYALWLLQTSVTQEGVLKTQPTVKQLFKEKRNHYLKQIQRYKGIRKRTKAFFIFAYYLPLPGGTIAYHKLNRYNTISKLYDFIFAVRSLYNPSKKSI